VVFLFLNFINKPAMMTSKIATTATPLPIPAFAPVLSPVFDEAAAGLQVCDALAVDENELPVEGAIMED
jgi:hypothetical protein